MDRVFDSARRCAPCLVLILAVLAHAGCGETPTTDHGVNVPQEQTVTENRSQRQQPMAAAQPSEETETSGPIAREADEPDYVARVVAEPSESPTESIGVVPRDRLRGVNSGGSGRTDNPRTTPGAPPLPQSGVLSSNFIGGHGVTARLEDLMDRGVTIDGQMVRLEAFQDRERLPYPIPSEEAVALYTELERTRLHSDRDLVHLQVALLARQGEAPRRPSLDVRLVIDRSGSMMGEKWTQAVAAAHALVDRLAPTDRFGLISYSDDASLDVPPAAIGNRRAAHAAIARLVAGGGTNIGAALTLAQAHAPVRRSASDVGLVLLISDGRASVGQTNPQELGRSARAMFDEAGVLTTSIGLGTDFDEETMLTIAREGSGSYHFVRRAGDIDEIVTDELESRVQAVAQALRLRFRLGEGVVARRVYGSRLLSEEEHARVRATEIATDERIARELGITENRQDEESGLRMHIPTFRRGDQHVILMELEVPAGQASREIARVTLDYKDLQQQRNHEIERTVQVERTSDISVAQASTQRLVKRTVLAFQAGEALQVAADALRVGNHAEAVQLLRERQQLLHTASTLWRDPTLARDAALLARYEQVLEHAWPTWDSSSRDTLMLAMNYYGDQRMH